MRGDLSDTVKLVDALFRYEAQQAVAEARRTGDDVTEEEMLQATWELFEDGQLRLVRSHGGGDLGYEACGFNRDERRAVAKQNRPLVEARRRQMASKASG